MFTNRAKYYIIVFLFIYPWISVAQSHAAWYKGEFNSLGSQIAGQPVTVHCGNIPNGDDGLTWQVIDDSQNTYFDPDIYLQKYICVGLDMLMHYHPKHFKPNTTWQSDRYDLMGLSIITLVHEAYHIKLNSSNEGIVECNAYQHVMGWIKSFKLSKQDVLGTWQAAKASHYGLPSMYLEVC